MNRHPEHTPGVAADDRTAEPGHAGPLLRIRFGPDVRVRTAAGEPLRVGSRKGLALLALLALSDDQMVSRATAAGLLWSRVERSRALGSLRDAIHRLGRELNRVGLDVLAATPEAVALRRGTVAVEPAAAGSGVPWTADEAPPDLIGLDPAFDLWLARAHARRGAGLRRDLGGLAEVASSWPAASRAGVRHGPSVRVAPVRGLGRAARGGLAEGVTCELAEALARSRWIAVRSPGALGVGGGGGGGDGPPDPGDLVLSGRLQDTGAALRLSVQLLDPGDAGAVLWQARVERPAGGDPTRLEEELAVAVAAQLTSRLVFVEAERMRRPGAAERYDAAYGLLLRAVPAIYRLDRDEFVAAGRLLREAVRLEPGSATARAWLAYWGVFLVGQGWAEQPAIELAAAEDAAGRAMLLDPMNARGFTVAGHVQAYLHRRPDRAQALHDQALRLNPGDPKAWHFSGVARSYAGDLTAALAEVGRALELAPLDPHAFLFEQALAQIHLLRGDVDRAVAHAEHATRTHPLFSAGWKTMTAALVLAGRRTEATGALARLLRLEPRFTVQRFRDAAPYRDPRHVDRLAAALRAAGAR